MPRTVKHFSLHRIGETELRIISDVEDVVLSLTEIEEGVIRGYAQGDTWPHRVVTLFILQDLQPLSRQIRSGADLPPGGATALEHRPVVNAYDLADLSECHVFVNRQAMEKESYWDDDVSIQGLLAHEHAHPLAENETTRASRAMELEVSVEGLRAPATSLEQQSGTDRREKVRALLGLLAGKLCLYAPREVFANELTIHSEFAAALLHLDRRTMANAARSVAGRDGLRRQLEEQVAQGALDAAEAEALLLIGDMKGYLDLAMEVAPFHRTGRESDAQELQGVLESEVFPRLAPEVPAAYDALVEQYIGLRTDMTSAKLAQWAKQVMTILTDALAAKGVALQYRLQTGET